MTRTNCLITVLVLVAASALPAFAGGPSKEMVELQTQVQTLVQLQQKTSEEMGVLRDKMNALVQQTTENLNKVSATVDKLVQEQQTSNDRCVDQLTGQAQPLHNELTELRGRVDAIIRQLNDMNGFRQGAPGTPAAPAPAASAQPPSKP